MIEKKNIRDMEHVKIILDELVVYRKAYEEQNGKMPETIIDKLGFQIAEVDEFIVEKYQKEDNQFDNFARETLYWEYVDGKLNYKDFINYLENYLKS